MSILPLSPASLGVGTLWTAMLSAILLIAGCQKFGPKRSVEPEALAKSQLEQETEEVEERGQQQAIAIIEDARGSFATDPQSPGKPVVRVDLSFTRIKDVDLTHLTALKQLQELYLINTNVTDAGLASLKSCAHLRTLDIAGTQITDAGMAYLSRLPELKTLGLSRTKISDAGIAQLKALGQLQLLDLSDTAVSNAGVREIEKGPAQAKILR